MLKQFEVSGYKGFKDKITLNLSDIRDYRFNRECVRDGLLDKAIIYGNNATGKTNLGAALLDIKSHLFKNDTPDWLYNYYLNTESETGYAEFHYVFQFTKNSVDYLYRKNSNQDLVFEQLAIDGKTLFISGRLEKIFDFEGLSEICTMDKHIDSEKGSVLKQILCHSDLADEHPFRQLNSFVSSMLWYGEQSEIDYRDNSTIGKAYRDFIFEEDNIAQFEEILKSSGVEKKLVCVYKGERRTLCFESDIPVPFFGTASRGILALYAFFFLYKTSSNVSFIYLDDFDVFYYYKLSEIIVDMLKKMNNTQIILTSHSTHLLSNNIMRPDCYFLLSNNKLTSFANATDREIRFGHNLEKLYLAGEFDS